MKEFIIEKILFTKTTIKNSSDKNSKHNCSLGAYNYSLRLFYMMKLNIYRTTAAQ